MGFCPCRKRSLPMPSWSLKDADAIADANKYTFYKPSRELIAKVKPGQVVKLMFAFESDDPEAPDAERMWVEVDRIYSDGRFDGRMSNAPLWIKDLALEDRVDFRACHIIDTEQDDSDNLVRRYSQQCLVTNRILEDRSKVGFLYREAAEGEKDSGWRITANDESAEYMAVVENCRVVPLGAVLAIDDSIIELLDAAAGSAFERDSASGQFFVLDEDT